MQISSSEIKTFQSKIRKFYRMHGRELPFRMIDNPYAVTVSEIMLQQTQVDRVVPKYQSWLKNFPTWEKLSEATNQSILSHWSGLGYNRRALYLKKIAVIVVSKYSGSMPSDIIELQKLPGIGKYTSHAIMIFAFQKRAAAVDINIRKVLLSAFELPPETSEVKTQEIAELVLPKTKIREWHYALMDYAKILPREVHQKYKNKYRQSKFEGSIRQIRGEIIRQLTKKELIAVKDISSITLRTELDISLAINGLLKDKIISISNDTIRLF